MNRIRVNAEVDAYEALGELDSADMADQLLDRLTSRNQRTKADAARAINKLGIAVSAETDWTDLLDELEEAHARGDRMHFAVLMVRLREGLMPSPAPALLAAMTLAEKRP